MPYRKDQWIDSFQGALALLRPHLSERLLGTMALAAWHRYGTKDIDPAEAAKQESARLPGA